MTYGKPPENLGEFPLDLQEVMYYLYLPVVMERSGIRLPANVEHCRELIWAAQAHAMSRGRDTIDDFIYLSARKGWATPDNPLNRPGWHADGFGTDDLNYVWWRGPGTRFLQGDIGKISDDHKKSIEEFEEVARWAEREGRKEISTQYEGKPRIIRDYPEAHLYAMDPYVVHATPIIENACWRQYIKVSISRHKYNLENNSHNYLFDYDWPLHSREEVRNDTFKAQRDFT